MPDSRSLVVPFAVGSDNTGFSGMGLVCHLMLRLTKRTTQLHGSILLPEPVPENEWRAGERDWVVNSTRCFQESLQYAWRAAIDTARQSTAPIAVDWSGSQPEYLVRKRAPGDNIIEVSESSASGAAALGWACLLCGLVVDPELVVMAEVTAKGDLAVVSEVPAKVEAICAAADLDAVAVVKENYEEARNVVKIAAGLIKVIKIDSLPPFAFDAPASLSTATLQAPVR